MKIRGTKTEVVKIEVTLDDVLTTLKNIILDKVYDDVDRYYVKDNKIIHTQSSYHNSFDNYVICDEEDKVEMFKKVLELEDMMERRK